MSRMLVLTNLEMLAFNSHRAQREEPGISGARREKSTCNGDILSIVDILVL